MTKKEIQELEAAISAFTTSKARYYKAKAEYDNASKEHETAQANDNRSYREKTVDISYWLGKCELALTASQNAVVEIQAATDALIPILDKLGYKEVIVGSKSFAVYPEYLTIFHEKYNTDTEQWVTYVAPQWAVIAMYI